MPSTTSLPLQAISEIALARLHTDNLFRILSKAALYSRPIPERHRLIFYLGHLEAFDWNQIGRAGLGCASFHPGFDRLFEFGIDPEPGRSPSDQPRDWPGEAEIRAYNKETRRRLDEVFVEAPEELLNVALEHRWMHAETLAYLLHQVPLDGKVAQTQDAERASDGANRVVTVSAGITVLGAQRGTGFGWDNEFEAHTVDMPEFRISQLMISNGEYLDFVKQGGPAPAFWVVDAGQWYLRCMFETKPLPLDWPVYVTWEQADAYARWRGAAVPSEAQWHRFADVTGKVAGGNYDFRRWDPEPAGNNPTGNGWQWTSTIFGPFEGFKPIASYPGYSANFFDGAHYVMKGASPRTAACMARRSFRNWFRPNYPYVYAGFRIVENS